jgi:hypothetical protein
MRVGTVPSLYTIIDHDRHQSWDARSRSNGRPSHLDPLAASFESSTFHSQGQERPSQEHALAEGKEAPAAVLARRPSNAATIPSL